MCGVVCAGTVVSMESVSMSWIIDEVPVTGTDKTIEDKKPLDTSKIDSKSDTATATEAEKPLPLPQAQDQDQVEEMKENVADEVEKQHTINRPAHTLVNINFKIKKGKNTLLAFS